MTVTNNNGRNMKQISKEINDFWHKFVGIIIVLFILYLIITFVEAWDVIKKLRFDEESTIYLFLIVFGMLLIAIHRLRR